MRSKLNNIFNCMSALEVYNSPLAHEKTIVETFSLFEKSSKLKNIYVFVAYFYSWGDFENAKSAIHSVSQLFVHR